jgi:cell division protein FtsX
MLEHLPVSPWLFVPLAAAAAGIVLLLGLGKVPLGYNLRNLVVRWRITVLTVLAFVLVLGLQTVMLAFVNGMARLAEGSGHPRNILVLSNGATDELMSNLSVSDVADVERQPGIQYDEHDGRRRPLCSRETYVVVAQPMPAATGDGPRRRLLQLRGMEDAEIAGRVHEVGLLPGGSWFRGVRSLRDSATGALGETVIEAVVGESIAREWGLGVGDLFDVGPRRWLVVGITQSAGTMFGSEIWADCRLVGQLFNKEGYYTSLVLRTAETTTPRQVSDDLTHNFKKAALSAQPEREYYAKLATTNSVFLYSAYVVAAIMAAGGVFGVMNTMFAAISQRTRDIGVLRILGFRRWQILISFLLESVILACAGGALGCALGYQVDGWTVTSFLENRTLVFRMIVDSTTLAVGMLFTISMGGLGGLLPAVSAMRVKPLESLR